MLGLVLLAAMALSILHRYPRQEAEPPRSMVTAAQPRRTLTLRQEARLREGEALLADRDFRGALASAEGVLKERPEEPRALGLKRQAENGLRKGSLCERFLSAADQGDVEVAATLFREVDEPCQHRGKGAVTLALPRYESAHRRLLRTATRSRQCEVVEEETRKLLVFSEQSDEAIAEEGQRAAAQCEQQQRAPRSRRRESSEPALRVSAPDF